MAREIVDRRTMDDRVQAEQLDLALDMLDEAQRLVQLVRQTARRALGTNTEADEALEQAWDTLDRAGACLDEGREAAEDRLSQRNATPANDWGTITVPGND